MLTRWLPKTPSTLPESILYNVGVGAFIVNSKDEMLLVKEASGVTKGLVSFASCWTIAQHRLLTGPMLSSPVNQLSAKLTLSGRHILQWDDEACDLREIASGCRDSLYPYWPLSLRLSPGITLDLCSFWGSTSDADLGGRPGSTV